MVGTGNAEGSGATNQETGPGLGDQANGKGRAKKEGGPELTENDGVDAADPLMPPKNAKTGTRAAKADAGKNGTGEGFEHGDEVGGDDSASSKPSRDDQNEEVDAKPGAAVPGDTSGMPAKAKAPTKKADAIAAAMEALTKAHAMKDATDGDGEVSNDNSTNGAQSKLPAKAKSPLTSAASTWPRRRIPGARPRLRFAPWATRVKALARPPRPARWTSALKTQPTPKPAKRAARSPARPRARPFFSKASRLMQFRRLTPAVFMQQRTTATPN